MQLSKMYFCFLKLSLGNKIISQPFFLTYVLFRQRAQLLYWDEPFDNGILISSTTIIVVFEIK
jgi:hypothetical protein